MSARSGIGNDVPMDDTTAHEPSDVPSASDETSEPDNVTVSTVFQPNSNVLPLTPDTALLSSDDVFFYVHSALLMQRSENNFGSLFPVALQEGESEHQTSMLLVREHSQVLNVILHTIYGRPCDQFSPTNDTLSAAIAALYTYGVPLAVHLAPGMPLFALLVARTPGAPLFIYTLAAQYDLYDLAAQASTFLLSLKLVDIGQECADRIGPVYLQRLISLQHARVEAMKEILREPPGEHPPTDHCDAETQAGMTRAWMLTAAYLIWEARPELTTTSMEVTFENVAGSIRCTACKTVFGERLARALNSWAQQRRTI